MSVIELTEKNWDTVVDASKGPVLVEFWAHWCPYCRQLNPIFERIAPDYEGKVTFAKVNIDDQGRIAEKFGVLTIPLLKVFCDARSVEEMSGLVPEKQLREFVDKIPERTQACLQGSTIRVNAKISAPGRDQDLILQSKTIAIVGLSKDPNKDSFSVGEYLKSRGFKIIPVNPTTSEILGEKAYPSLLDIPADLARTIDIVDVFRPSDQVPPIVDQAIKLREKYKTNPKSVWMQLGIENPAAAEKAKSAGLVVAQNMCIAVEHRRRTMGVSRVS